MKRNKRFHFNQLKRQLHLMAKRNCRLESISRKLFYSRSSVPITDKLDYCKSHSFFGQANSVASANKLNISYTRTQVTTATSSSTSKLFSVTQQVATIKNGYLLINDDIGIL